ncbi:DUF2309 domain-containing protein [Cryobacterium sp. CG_9.6]|uniref:DUF2309 domain-containing protein n=1 Tax=Cryobacterium sp. CG_9.6 TaxID=2760710 RepID=UPI0024749A24|nr:DUF2309 domain-containing protein [Cryobacterium sp. CG_9.6]MDH6238321.1 uncharacterized protein YbcC (UPF0753/DUF2309 family) [Cryobacterium sp. CG_9.6]
MNLEIRAAVARATRSVIPLWPLSSFIAVNPLGAQESEDFDQAATTRPRTAFLADYRSARITDRDLLVAARQRMPELAGAGSVCLGEREWTAAELVTTELVHADHHGTPPTPTGQPDLVDDLVSIWIAAYLDPHPLWPMPQRERGPWAAWTALVRYDPRLPAVARRRLRDLPGTPDAGLARALALLGVPAGDTETILRRETQRLPGWAAHIKWRSDRVGDIDVTSYLAIRLTLRWALDLPVLSSMATPQPESATVWDRAQALTAVLTDAPASGETLAQVARILGLHSPQAHAFTWQAAYEEHYRRQLLLSLDNTNTNTNTVKPSAQVVMCIDVRSEGIRRHLEADPTIETYGFAGFFGIPIRFAHYEARGSIDALPALLSARHSVTETTTDLPRSRRRTRALRLRDAFAAGVHASESVPAAPFALAETLGWFHGAGTLLRTLWPSAAHAVTRLHHRSTPALATRVTVADAFPLDERVALAETGLRMMGLDAFAPLIVLAAHGSTSSNNMYQSALDCGACGGNPGAANARAAAANFNDPEVRRLLADRGFSIPDTSYFVAAEHNTMSDRIDIVDQHLIPDSHTTAVQNFRGGQSVAADLLVSERAAQLPGARRHSLTRVRQRAHDWAEVYPELGLAGNSAMIIGPRDMTRGVDLQRRVFLHSYRPECDPDGSALETIMTAPLVVAQWINHQYYFSAVDQDRWGAGTKTVHNAIGTMGVLSGQTGDLQAGLPLQSIAVGDRALHEPLRLSVLIQAPLDRIGTIISRNQVLRHLFDNNWITLTARNDQTSAWFRYSAYGWTSASHLDTTP